MHGTAFFFTPTTRLTARDYFAEKAGPRQVRHAAAAVGRQHRRADRQDKLHYFVNLERIDRTAVTTNIPARPDLSRTDFETRACGTPCSASIIRSRRRTPAASAGCAKHHRSRSRSRRENQTPTRARGRDRRRLDGRRQVQLGDRPTRRSTRSRSRPRHEDVFFGNPILRHQRTRSDEPAAAVEYRTSRISRARAPTAGRIAAYSVDDMFAWFLPGKRGDHDLKFGVNYSVLVAAASGLRQPERHVHHQQRPAVRPQQSANLSRSAEVRVPNAVRLLREGALHRDVRAGQMEAEQQPDAERSAPATTSSGSGRRRTTTRCSPTMPATIRRTRTTISPRLGSTWALDGDGRSVVRGGFGLFFQRTPFTFVTNMFSNGRFSDSFTQSFPVAQRSIRVRARATSRPIRSSSTVRSSTTRSSTRCSRRARESATPAPSTSTTPIEITPYSRQASLGYERQLGPTMGSASITSAPISAISTSSRTSIPATRSNGLATGAITRNTPLVATPGEFTARVDTLDNIGYINYNSIQVSGTSGQQRLSVPRLSYTLSRAHGNTATGQADTANDAGPRRLQSGPGGRADGGRSAARPVGERVRTKSPRPAASTSAAVYSATERDAVYARRYDLRRRPQRPLPGTNICPQAPTAAPAAKTPSTSTTSAASAAHAGRTTSGSICAPVTGSGSAAVARCRRTSTCST